MPDCPMAEAIEHIDIGGPAMLRAAAKNHEYVTAVVDPADYAQLLETLHADNGTTLDLRRRLAAKVYAHTARYDGVIANWLGARLRNDRVEQFPANLHLAFYTRQTIALRRESAPERRACTSNAMRPSGDVATARLLAGKELSFNNIADADAALECVKAFQKARPASSSSMPIRAASHSATVRSKPTNTPTPPIRYPRSAASLRSINALDAATARAIVQRQFVEVVIAPHVDADALDAFAQKPNVRVLACGEWPEQARPSLEFKRIADGLLVQDADRDTLLLSDFKVVSKRMPDAEAIARFAVRVARCNVRQIQCHRVCARRPHHRHRRRPDEPRDQREDRCNEGRGSTTGCARQP